ncbi:MAG: DUF1653 domain-containing protein [Candidatus Pacebacteria bacterium]|nr:DUF1653 domain-containing protein [Candidatus Paceibacterota bacterium]
MNLPFGFYKHYKGEVYRVVGSATHSETLEEMVVYEAQTDKKLWVRPLAMFLEDVEVEEKKMKRFEYIGAIL